ncbi:hypothetical protein FT643_22015 [Ketobacter sp. MCCC 1A13808]|uniref:hypothetical protein n=1 Tax=Ketobacter sp. MCCC 1A13808 TaxID=2602738 RepID=UPI0012EBABB5|nr:hypothetical protein [Ketobacter sp. MCCC 1A13808]MVF14816.1 hypothetical protein [Ketobacter sp. MCCC 1A13808]
MTIKKREARIEDVEKLANELADKPYGAQANSTEERLVRTSLSLPASMHEILEDMARENKRAGKELRTVSAIVREAIEKYLKHNS